jgi:chemotaxis protein histidine kinase CheA
LLLPRPPTAKAKTPAVKKSTRKAAPPPDEGEGEEEEAASQPAKSTRKKAAPSAKKAAAKAALLSPLGATPASVHAKAMTPPSPEEEEEEEEEEEKAATVRVAGRRGNKLVSAEQPRLDARFAAVDDTPRGDAAGAGPPVDPALSAGVRRGVDWLAASEGTTRHRTATAHASSSAYASRAAHQPPSSAWVRLALPLSYLAAMLALLLLATGRLPAAGAAWEAGSGSGARFGRPPRRGQELAANVTFHLQGHLAPLLRQLRANGERLAAEAQEVAGLHAALDDLARDKASVKQQLVDAIAKVRARGGRRKGIRITKRGKKGARTPLPSAVGAQSS